MRKVERAAPENARFGHWVSTPAVRAVRASAMARLAAPSRFLGTRTRSLPHRLDRCSKCDAERRRDRLIEVRMPSSAPRRTRCPWVLRRVDSHA
jgi:hypothetical protein